MEEKEFSLSGSPTAFPETESPPAIRFGGSGSVPQETSTIFNTSTGIVAAAPAGGGGGSVPQETSTTFNTSTGSGGGYRGGGGSDGVLGKKKRGRPRKYDSDGNLRVPTKSPRPTGFFLSPPPPSDFSGKRGRGRPAGSGNWQVLASLGGLFANTAGGDFTPHVVTVYTGEDVAAKILSFSAKGPRGICVLSANGAVSNVTIRQPGSSGGLLTYEGRFEILSLTGSFTVSENGGVRSRIGGLSVSLAGPDGRVVGGGIAGLLTAASPIQIVVGSFMPNGFKVHKRKHHLEPRTAPDTVTEAMPISQAAPGANISLTRTSQLPSENHEEADNNTSNEHHLNGTSPDSGEWNGSEPASAQRPYPDINISVSVE